jgi:hypothetical protein
VKNQLRNSGASWKSAADYERRARQIPQGAPQQALHNAALNSYLESVHYLDAARQNLTTPSGPETYVPLARGHLDVARELVLLHREQEAKQHLESAQNILLLGIMAEQGLSHDWLWKVFYLLGDVNLMQKNQPIAVLYYQKAANLEPAFVPAAAMVRYFDGNSHPESSSSASENTLRPSPPPATGSTTQTPQPPPAQLEKHNAVETMSNDFAQVTRSERLVMAGTGLTLIAEIFEVAELGPLGTAIELGTLIDGALAKAETRLAINK